MNRDPETPGGEAAEGGLPRLVDPVLVAAFEGWNDAGEAASTAVEHLELAWDAKPLGSIDPEEYYDFQVTRPHIRLSGGVTRRIEWQTTRLSYAEIPGTGKHIVLVSGIEPNMRWRAFCREILDWVEKLGVTKVITLGALLTDIPHTRPTAISGISFDRASAGRMRVEPSTYEGPTGIVGVLHDACRTAEVESVSFWVHVPHYANNPPCPKATLALLHRIEEVLDVQIPMGSLPEEAALWEQRVRAATEQDAELAAYVRELEERAGADLTPRSGDEIAQQIERYLRRRGGPTGPVR